MSKLGKLLHEDPQLQTEFDRALERRASRTVKRYEWEIVQHLQTIAGLKSANAELRIELDRVQRELRESSRRFTSETARLVQKHEIGRW